MSREKFTPAPWAVVTNSAGDLEVVKQRFRDKGEEWIPITYDATVAMGIGDHTDEETNGNELANAHLIAAAPEMYDEIESDIANLNSLLMDMDPHTLEAAATERKIKRKTKLLAKARGES